MSLVRRILGTLLLTSCLLALPSRAGAIGWDSDDFLIGGGPSFTTRIGVFDHDLSFKGYLDSSFITVAGMDFDAAGHLVAVASALREVRLYDSSGSRIGGFMRSDDLLGTPGDLKVAPDGSYAIATQNFGGGDGARQFTPDGSYVRQYGSGWIRGTAVVPGNRVWIGGVGSSAVSVFDLASGALLEVITVTGLSGVNSMSYSTSTNTVLLAEVQVSAGLETDLNGNVIHVFNAPFGISVNALTRGPDGDIFATTGGSQSILRWRADGTFVGSVSTAATIGGTGAIVWAGTVPEPQFGMVLTIGPTVLLRRSHRHRREGR